MSDVHGRRIALLCTFVVFLGACIGLALSRHFYQLLILRCLQSTGSASTIAIGAGIIGDVTTREERGGFMGVFQTGLLLPLGLFLGGAGARLTEAAVGPVLGGIFAAYLGWRAIFWFLAIYASCFLVALALLLPETLRNIVGNGGISPARHSRAVLERWTASRATTIEDPLPVQADKRAARVDFLAPVRIVFYPEVFFVLFFLSLHYASWQMALTAQSSLFESTYHLSEVDVGLTFLANGVGTMLGSLTTGRLLDRDYRRIKVKFEGAEADFPLETARLRNVWLWSPIQWGSVLLFGWTIDRDVHIAAPIVASFCLAWSAMSAQSVITTFLVDVFPHQSASATAALNLARCLMGAAATATVEPSIKRMGTGWTFTMWTGLLVLSLGLVAVQMKHGAKWRRRRQQREETRHGADKREQS